MKYRYSKIPLRKLVVCAAGVVAAVVIVKLSATYRPMPCYDQQLKAATMMRDCIAGLREMNALSSENIEHADPNRTHLIGWEYSAITTTLGDLKAKRTSTNPDFAALFGRWFYELEIAAGDTVAIGGSSSFPALMLAAICAAENMQIVPVIIPSLGASGYGANRPQLTYLDLEYYLYRNGYIHCRSSAASLGGVNDVAADLDSVGRYMLVSAIERNGIPLIYMSDVKNNIETRAHIYAMNGEPKVFINIGGAQINIGSYHHAKRIHPGVNRNRSFSISAPKSMAAYFLEKGFPMIHLLEIERIAHQYRLAIDPVPLPEAGHSGVYYEENVPLSMWVISMALVSLSVVILGIHRVRIGKK